MYDKLALSSLDERYPQLLLREIGVDAGQHKKQIEAHVRRLYLAKTDKVVDAWRESCETADLDMLYRLMDTAPTPGVSVARVFARKYLQSGMPADEIFKKMSFDFDRQSILRKVNSYHVVCILCQINRDEAQKAIFWPFIQAHKDGQLPLLNQFECAFLRFTRKFFTLALYPRFREEIAKELASAPELERYVDPPNSLSRTLEMEIRAHDDFFLKISAAGDADLQNWLTTLLERERGLEARYVEARAQLHESEQQLLGFECYGEGGRHYAFGGLFKSMFPNAG
jgi:hypothetical protein